MFNKKRQCPLKKATTLALLCCALPAMASEVEFSGSLTAEARYFFAGAQYDGQLAHSQGSFVFAPEIYWGSDNGNHQVIFQPYYRIDGQDSQRSHADIRELSYTLSHDNWELRTGIRKEFWGVTEFQHLVDVINQSDTVDTFGGEEKLGQLMLNFSVAQDWGIVDLFILPGFRERTVVGEAGRLRSGYLIDADDVSYESDAQENHVDVAARWTHVLGDVDVGTHWFHGTNREPRLSVSGANTLAQYYAQMSQVGIDIQATLGDWLWKLESIYRSTDSEDFTATQAGFEYSFYGLLDSNADLGLLLEHSWDSRGEYNALYQNDAFIGARLAFNDARSSEMLMGVSRDIDHNATSFVLEASRRLGENHKINLNMYLFDSDDTLDQLHAITHDDHFNVSMQWFF